MQNNNIFGAMALTACVALMSATTLMAAPTSEEDGDAPVLVVKKADGQDILKLAEIVSIKYTATDMVVNMTDGSTRSIAMAEVATMLFSTKDNYIGDIMADCQDGDRYIVMDLAGKVVARGVIENGKMVGAPALKGVYVITVGRNSKTVILK